MSEQTLGPLNCVPYVSEYSDTIETIVYIIAIFYYVLSFIILHNAIYNHLLSIFDLRHPLLQSYVSDLFICLTHALLDACTTVPLNSCFNMFTSDENSQVISTKVIDPRNESGAKFHLDKSLGQHNHQSHHPRSIQNLDPDSAMLEVIFSMRHDPDI